MKKCSTHKHPLKWYPENYGLPEGTFIRYYKLGYPLDDPEKLLERILSNVHGIKPDLTKLQALVEALPGRRKRPKAASVQPGRTEAAPEEPDDEQNDASGAFIDENVDLSKLEPGVAQELKRMQHECMVAYRDYKRARRPLDKLALHKVWVALVKSMRELAKDAPTAEKEARTVVEVGDVDSAWTRAFQEFRTAADNVARRVSTNKLFAEFRDKGLDPVDIEAVVRGETDKMIADLEKGSWLENNQNQR